MTETNVFQLAQPGAFTDSLTEVLRDGARALAKPIACPCGRLMDFAALNHPASWLSIEKK